MIPGELSPFETFAYLVLCLILYGFIQDPKSAIGMFNGLLDWVKDIVDDLR